MFLRGIPFITCVLQDPILHRFFHKSSSHAKAENIKRKNIERGSVGWNDRYLLYLFSPHSFHSLSLVTLSVWTVFLQSPRQLRFGSQHGHLERNPGFIIFPEQSEKYKFRKTYVFLLSSEQLRERERYQTDVYLIWNYLYACTYFLACMYKNTWRYAYVYA